MTSKRPIETVSGEIQKQVKSKSSKSECIICSATKRIVKVQCQFGCKAECCADCRRRMLFKLDYSDSLDDLRLRCFICRRTRTLTVSKLRAIMGRSKVNIPIYSTDRDEWRKYELCKRGDGGIELVQRLSRLDPEASKAEVFSPPGGLNEARHHQRRLGTLFSTIVFGEGLSHDVYQNAN